VGGRTAEKLRFRHRAIVLLCSQQVSHKGEYPIISDDIFPIRCFKCSGSKLDIDFFIIVFSAVNILWHLTSESFMSGTVR